MRPLFRVILQFGKREMYTRLFRASCTFFTAAQFFNDVGRQHAHKICMIHSSYDGLESLINIPLDVGTVGHTVT